LAAGAGGAAGVSALGTSVCSGAAAASSPSSAQTGVIQAVNNAPIKALRKRMGHFSRFFKGIYSRI
jgi:hypothetical protein